MKKAPVLLAILVLIAFSGTAWAQVTDGTYRAAAVLKNANGTSIGTAQFAEDTNGLAHIRVQVSGLSPGKHGIHIHESGNCSPPAFTSAGEHYNPLGKQHGLENPNGHHAGDLPNLVVGSDGTGLLNTTTDRVTLSPGPATLFSANGTSLVIHAGPDDQKSDPSGNSGGRIACGVIEAK